MKRKRLPDTGAIINAEYDSTLYDTAITVNNKHPYVLRCHWRDPETGRTLLLKSPYLWEDPDPIIRTRNITCFPVRIDPNNEAVYEIDLSVLDRPVSPF